MDAVDELLLHFRTHFIAIQHRDAVAHVRTRCLVFLGAFRAFEIHARNHRRADAGWRTGQHIFRGFAHDRSVFWRPQHGNRYSDRSAWYLSRPQHAGHHRCDYLFRGHGIESCHLQTNYREFPVWVADALKRLGDTLAPLALVSVGLQLRFDQTKGLKTALATGLGFKLLLAPAVLAFGYFSILGTTEEVTRVTLFEAAMGPQIGGAIVAVQHGLNPPLVSLMVGLGRSFSFLTLRLWSYALHLF